MAFSTEFFADDADIHTTVIMKNETNELRRELAVQHKGSKGRQKSIQNVIGIFMSYFGQLRRSNKKTTTIIQDDKGGRSVEIDVECMYNRKELMQTNTENSAKLIRRYSICDLIRQYSIWDTFALKTKLENQRIENLDMGNACAKNGQYHIDPRIPEWKTTYNLW